MSLKNDMDIGAIKIFCAFWIGVIFYAFWLGLKSVIMLMVGKEKPQSLRCVFAKYDETYGTSYKM